MDAGQFYKFAHYLSNFLLRSNLTSYTIQFFYFRKSASHVAHYFSVSLIIVEMIKLNPGRQWSSVVLK